MRTSHAVRASCSLVAVLDLVGRNKSGLEGGGHGGGQSGYTDLTQPVELQSLEDRSGLVNTELRDPRVRAS